MLENLFSTNLSTNPSSDPTTTLTLRSHFSNPGLTTVHLASSGDHGPPQYSIQVSEKPQPNIVIYAGTASPESGIGHASINLLTGSIALSLRGHDITMKTNNFTGADFKFSAPTFGELKWSLNQWTGSGLELYDGAGRKLAKLKSSGTPGLGGKKLEVLLPGSESLVELMILSGMAAQTQIKASNEMAGELIQNLVGGGGA